ncbi:hypothetical protein NDN08_007942 [Rhodosorus marinus]|uniref:Calmodulin-lysine N-methyltransferase n=1 Tax=Rhodosorus marinus TaxID=101924 RepID=A0AAV8V330_9RHOD|nr:hypothetical protein NDN08_007942 [Rhodosorus marinus]
MFHDAIVIELGAGVGLPGLAAASVGARKVYLCDRAEHEDVLALIQSNISLNNHHDVCEVRPLTWGCIDTKLLAWTVKPDVILGSDLFYRTADFEPLLATLTALFEKNPQAVFVTVYEERSARRTLDPLLELWNMRAESVAFEGCDEQSNLFLYHIYSRAVHKS